MQERKLFFIQTYQTLIIILKQFIWFSNMPLRPVACFYQAFPSQAIPFLSHCYPIFYVFYVRKHYIHALLIIAFDFISESIHND